MILVSIFFSACGGGGEDKEPPPPSADTKLPGAHPETEGFNPDVPPVAGSTGSGSEGNPEKTPDEKLSDSSDKNINNNNDDHKKDEQGSSNTDSELAEQNPDPLSPPSHSEGIHNINGEEIFSSENNSSLQQERGAAKIPTRAEKAYENIREKVKQFSESIGPLEDLPKEASRQTSDFYFQKIQEVEALQKELETKIRSAVSQETNQTWRSPTVGAETDSPYEKAWREIHRLQKLESKLKHNQTVIENQRGMLW